MGLQTLGTMLSEPIKTSSALYRSEKMHTVARMGSIVTNELDRGFRDTIYPRPIKVWEPDPPKTERHPVSGEKDMTTATLSEKPMATLLKELRESVPRESNGEEFNAAKTERISAGCGVDDVVRQGDLYFICLEKLPEGKPTSNRQLVPGTTQGSRHILDGDVKIVKDVQFKRLPAALVGPAFECVSDVTATHPEHGHKVFPAGTFWQSLGQQAYDQEMIRRVRD